MKFKLSKEFCLWVVPGNDGRVHKVRFSLRRALILLLTVTLVGFGALVVAGDYARVQLVRINHALSVKKLSVEKQKLAREVSDLRGELRLLEGEGEKGRLFQSQIEERLEEISSILHTASELFPTQIPVHDLSNQYSDKEDGVGGAEIECTGNCLSTALSSGSYSTKLMRSDFKNDIVERFDHYITSLKNLPLGYPAIGHVSSPYGLRKSPFSGHLRVHQGIDISLPWGSEIVASGNGVIESVKRTRTYGLVVDIRHASNLLTRYAHLSKALVSEGEKVCVGETIGLAGSSGHSTGPHLHYEIRVDGQALDPQEVLKITKDLQAVLRSR